MRKKLKSTMPKAITKSFVAAAMDIKEVSAQMNVIAPMKQLGLLDDNGAPTQLANKWRSDETYAAACKDMRENTYPQELLDLAPTVETEKSIIQSWISSHLMVGEESARQSTTVYLLLLEADATKQSELSVSVAAAANKTDKTIKRSSTIKPKQQPDEGNKIPPDERNKKVRASFDQSMNINIQIHISSETSAEQIDKIFSSMAKHLKSINEE
ncbi:MAG: DUF5343 domain-containing protein [Methylophilus sp.]